GSRGEQHRIGPAGSSRLNPLDVDAWLSWRTPAVHEHAVDRCPGGLKSLVKPVRARAVVLHRDAQPVDAFAQQVLTKFRRSLGLRDPVRFKASSLDRTARLWPTRDEA